MALLDNGLKALFGAAFAAFYLDATLHKSSISDTGTGGFGLSGVDYPAKAMVAALSERARAASGLPEPAVSLSILRAGLGATPDLGDSVTVAGQRYRLIRIELYYCCETSVYKVRNVDPLSRPALNDRSA